MKYLVFLLINCCLIAFVNGQNIDFDIIVLDDSEHFNPNPDSTDYFDSNLIIDSDSIFRRVFYWSPAKVDCPYFKEKILLKRTIIATCLATISNEVKVDKAKKTVLWTSIIQKASCKSRDIRHIVISIPAFPKNYTINFKESILEPTLETTEVENKIVDYTAKLMVSSVECFPSRLFECFGGLLIDNDSLFNYWKTRGVTCEKPDFKNEMILMNTFGGDCKMKLIPHLFYDPVTDVVLMNVYNLYGGCRAGGWESLSFVVKKSQKDTKVVFQEIQVESMEDYENRKMGKN